MTPLARNGGLAALGAAAVAGAAWWAQRAPSVTPLPLLPAPHPTAVRDADAALTADAAAADTAQREAIERLLASVGAMGASGADALHQAELTIGTLPHAAGRLAIVVADAQAPVLQRIDACRLLGTVRERRAIPLLGRLLAATDGSVPSHLQAAAAEALGAIGDRAALVVLLPVLHDNRPPDWRVTTAVAIAACDLGARSAGQACVEVLSNWHPDLAARPRVFERERAAACLRALGERIARPAPAGAGNPYRLPTALRAESEAWTTWWGAVRARITPRADVTTDLALLDGLLRPHLATFSGESVFYRKLAQLILQDLGAEGLAYLLHALRDERSSWRQYAAEALGSAGHPSAITFLSEAFSVEQSALVRAALVAALQHLAAGDPAPEAALLARAEGVFIAAADDPDPGVRALLGR